MCGQSSGETGTCGASGALVMKFGASLIATARKACAMAHARLFTDRWRGGASHHLCDSQMNGLRLRGDLAACPTNDKLASLGSKLMCPNRSGGGKIDLDQGSLTARVRKIFASSWAGSARAQQESLDCISIEEEGLCAS